MKLSSIFNDVNCENWANEVLNTVDMFSRINDCNGGSGSLINTWAFWRCNWVNDDIKSQQINDCVLWRVNDFNWWMSISGISFDVKECNDDGYCNGSEFVDWMISSTCVNADQSMSSSNELNESMIPFPWISIFGGRYNRWKEWKSFWTV